MIPVRSDVRVWLASGHTDMRKGMGGLALLVQEGLGRDPFLCVGRDYVAELRRCPPSLPSLESSAT
jgi:transposase